MTQGHESERETERKRSERFIHNAGVDSLADAQPGSILKTAATALDDAGRPALAAALRRSVANLERAAFARGMDLAADVSQRETDRWAEMLLQVSAAMRGKDRADGTITTDVYPDPAVYDWRSEDDHS